VQLKALRVPFDGQSQGKPAEERLRKVRMAHAPQSAPTEFNPTSLTARKPKLLDQLREALRSRHYSRRTEQTYCHWVKRFIYFHHVRV
jgi:hypothetical protein